MAKTIKDKTVLIVEDDEPILRVLTDKMTNEGLTVIQARDGREGLKKALKERPDLILLDILMPGMDGMEMLKALRRDKWGKAADVVILTNLSYEIKEEEAMEYGVQDYWVKSDWRIDDIAKKVKARLKSKKK
jgi:DNA-binding response OmpR family regulator